MTKKIKCQPFRANSHAVKVRIVKAPLVDTNELRNVISGRARALVL